MERARLPLRDRHQIGRTTKDRLREIRAGLPRRQQFRFVIARQKPVAIVGPDLQGREILLEKCSRRERGRHGSGMLPCLIAHKIQCRRPGLGDAQSGLVRRAGAQKRPERGEVIIPVPARNIPQDRGRVTVSTGKGANPGPKGLLAVAGIDQAPPIAAARPARPSQRRLFIARIRSPPAASSDPGHWFRGQRSRYRRRQSPFPRCRRSPLRRHRAWP